KRVAEHEGLPTARDLDRIFAERVGEQIAGMPADDGIFEGSARRRVGGGRARAPRRYEPLLRRFAGVDRTADSSVPPRCGCWLFHAASALGCTRRLLTPKNRGPDQWAPVIRSAITVSER